MTTVKLCYNKENIEIHVASIINFLNALNNQSFVMNEGKILNRELISTIEVLT